MENHELISKALAYINKEKCKSEINIDDVARAAGFSADYFNRIFRSHTGYNVMEYIRFRRLVHAAMQLRRSERTVVDIGLACGYDSQDGFCRAFKGLYGKTPGEYREAMKNCQIEFADLRASEVAGARITHALPNYKVIPSDTVIDYLLETDAKRFGYDAVSFKWNGTALLSDADIEKDGCFIGADMFDSGYNYMYVHVKRLCELRKYVDAAMKLSPKYISVGVEEYVTEEQVKKCLEDIRCKSIAPVLHAMYLGDKLPIPQGGEKYTFYALTKVDLRAFEVWAAEIGANKDWANGVRQSLELPLENRYADQSLGLFDGERLVGIARVCMQEAHGFKLNNCVTCSLLSEYKTDEAYRILYTYALNYVIDCGYIPYEETQFGEETRRIGNFTAIDMGYELVNTEYVMKF